MGGIFDRTIAIDNDASLGAPWFEPPASKGVASLACLVDMSILVMITPGMGVNAA